MVILGLARDFSFRCAAAASHLVHKHLEPGARLQPFAGCSCWAHYIAVYCRQQEAEALQDTVAAMAKYEAMDLELRNSPLVQVLSLIHVCHGP